MQFIGIIPARYNSTRFPGKPLAMIHGRSMIQRVYEQAAKSEVLTGVFVATDDQRIEDHVKSFGGEVVMTSSDHKSGTDRCFEAASKLKQELNILESDVIVNIQGDEPYINPLQIKQIANCFQRKEVNIATLIKKIELKEDLFNPNVVKCIVSDSKKAIYFSRQAIPFLRNVQQDDWIKVHSFYKHIGIYAYSYHMLASVVKLEQTSFEKAESLEQLRWIQNDLPVYVEFTDVESKSVDSPEDIDKL